MKTYAWNTEKNEKLRRERGVSFETVAFHIGSGDVLAVVDHPNQLKYRGQRMYIVRIGDYAYLIPFVETEKEIFLKTIIPSRKATKQYLKKE